MEVKNLSQHVTGICNTGSDEMILPECNILALESRLGIISRAGNSSPIRGLLKSIFKFDYHVSGGSLVCLVNCIGDPVISVELAVPGKAKTSPLFQIEETELRRWLSLEQEAMTELFQQKLEAAAWFQA